MKADKLHTRKIKVKVRVQHCKCIDYNSSLKNSKYLSTPQQRKIASRLLLLTMIAQTLTILETNNYEFHFSVWISMRYLLLCRLTERSR